MLFRKSEPHFYCILILEGSVAYFEADELSVSCPVCPSVVPSRSATLVLPSSLFLTRRIIAGGEIARLSTTTVAQLYRIRSTKEESKS